MHFNIGDEVVVTGPTRCGSNAHIGKKFKITERDDIYFSTLDLPWFHWRSLELVPSLKVGDWVEVVGPAEFGDRSEYRNIFQINLKENRNFAGKGFSETNYRTFYYPSSSLRKLTPEEALCHITKRPSEYIDASLEERMSAIEERLASIEQRMSSLERLQNEQSKNLVMKQWSAGP